MTTDYHLYGDESLVDGHVVYGIIAIPVSRLDVIETILGDVKESFGAARSAIFHCRELFHEHARRKSEWAHLSSKDVYELAFELATRLSGNGIRTAIGHVNSSAILGREMAGVGDSPGMSLDKSGQMIPWAFQGAISQFMFDSQFKGRCKLWIEPNKDLIEWFGKRRQVGRLLITNSVEIESDAMHLKEKLVPENLETKDAPQLLQLADFLSYCSCRVIANSGSKKSRYSDQIIKSIFDSMNPSVGKFKLAGD